ncbi:hypothetical protein [Mumia zhuanghuii]|uniref:Uncharacterized protein n=1 Tax=Mumia zhuanghuii TaxID=2585211 RepID=A0A5C4M5C8_9ACTN|nr:hypothetical protein [Mumia zhuanghuii]TNC26841.1 hypothetical protein FHE65_34440 [Mumia zhuanghuii]
MRLQLLYKALPKVVVRHVRPHRGMFGLSELPPTGKVRPRLQLPSKLVERHAHRLPWFQARVGRSMLLVKSVHSDKTDSYSGHLVLV